MSDRKVYSYHNFMFPFQWRIEGYEDKTFSEQISLRNIAYSHSSNWERSIIPEELNEANDLYNERNYFYEFVHDALYDNGKTNTLIWHCERKEPQHGEVLYVIESGMHLYKLKVNSINLNLYSTGVGVLTFYLHNEKYQNPSDVLKINQVGRRVFPPYINSVEDRKLIAKSIEILGLQGSETGYREDFSSYTNKTQSNTPASFIHDMILEAAPNIILKPVIDDRMFVQCWYKNDEWTSAYIDNYQGFLSDSNWYEFVFVDDLGEPTCQNKEMRAKLLKEATYERWQDWGSLYGITRYSMVYLTNNGCPSYLTTYFETIYARMAELILVQKASVLRFSSEVTNISNMEEKKGFSEKVSSLYKEYIRFVNQIHFREISAQDQGIEMYKKLYDAMNLGEHVSKLDAEIEELYNYVSLSEDRKNNATVSLLTWIATIAVPMTMVAGFFGMNNIGLNGELENAPICWFNRGFYQFVIAVSVTVLVLIIVQLIKNKKSK